MPDIFQPHPYQQEAIDWILSRDNSGVFASPGTGKTVVTFTAIEQLIASGECRGALIVGPIRVGVLTYPNQIEQWEHLRWMRYHNLRTPEGEAAWNAGNGEIFFINFEMLGTRKDAKRKGFVERCIKGRRKLPVDIIVVDESSKLKAHDGKAAKTLIPFLHDIPGRYKSPFKRRIILTGTPASESYLSLWNQIRIIDNGERLGRSFWQFRQTWFNSDYMGWRFEIKPGAKESIDAKLSDIALVVRGEDHLDLPPCEVIDIDVELPPPVRKIYKTLEKEMLVTLETGDITALSAAALITKLTQVTSGCCYDEKREIHAIHDAKLKALHKLRKEYPDEPMLVMIGFIHERELLLKEFPDAVEFHEDRMPDWQAGKIPIFVCHPASMSHGIDGLQVWRILVWMTLTYSNELYQQANARLLRMGQKRPTLIFRIMASSSVDWAVAEALRNKEDQQRGLMAAVKNLQQLRKQS